MTCRITGARRYSNTFVILYLKCVVITTRKMSLCVCVCACYGCQQTNDVKYLVCGSGIGVIYYSYYYTQSQFTLHF